MSWASWLIIGMIGFTSFMAAVVVSVIIGLTLYEVATLTYQRVVAERRSEGVRAVDLRL
jgi:hypothetical protein